MNNLSVERQYKVECHLDNEDWGLFADIPESHMAAYHINRSVENAVHSINRGTSRDKAIQKHVLPMLQHYDKEGAMQPGVMDIVKEVFNEILGEN